MHLDRVIYHLVQTKRFLISLSGGGLDSQLLYRSRENRTKICGLIFKKGNVTGLSRILTPNKPLSLQGFTSCPFQRLKFIQEQ